MDLKVFSSTELPFALGALGAVAAANGSVSAPEQQMFDFLAALHGAPEASKGIAPVSVAELAGAIPDAHARRRLLQLALVTAMVDGDPTPAQVQAVARLAEALGTDDNGLKALHHHVAGNEILVRFDVMRRMFGGSLLGADAQTKGGSFVTMFSAINGLNRPDPKTAGRYRRLGLLPAGTFGREFWTFATLRGFSFPGEVGGIPELMVFHDFGHVLSGYDTDPIGEIRQGAFQAGYRRSDGFVFLLFALNQMHLGHAINPFVKVTTGLFDVPQVLDAVARGAVCRIDLSDHWQPWDWVEKPLEEVREAYGIPPLTFSGPGIQVPGQLPPGWVVA